ncbi:hypothetical protein C791_6107 [Amycolatopsis azurea DSM 43854]|uniref:Uncharacterized protein n=1 Tax=Amycolatopsis azurea DSM 43854 TaxID=1238180 RepID=M2P1X4_9PSEU|nr:hypothetical protein C791_6107 [Amycolatopsis azurea DSM 43854]
MARTLIAAWRAASQGSLSPMLALDCSTARLMTSLSLVPIETRHLPSVARSSSTPKATSG